MKQVVENIKTGKVEVIDVPIPHCGYNQVLIATKRSLISAGTERMLVEFGRSSIWEKAKKRPDDVKKVIEKIKTEGLIPTVNAVFSRLDQPLPLGYCNSGIVADVSNSVTELSIGDRVASNGLHAEYVCVSKNLVAKIPDNVSDDEAAFTPLAAVALQGVRLANPSLGENIAVIGLGLVGLITVQLLIANGCHVLGIDYDLNRLNLAEKFGAKTVNLSKREDPLQIANALTHGKGMDAVIITASSKSSSPIHQAALMSRKRGKIIMIGVTGMELKRELFYEKELTFQVSSSYGPGRYDPNYEIKGQDYPYGFVRWTAQRNFQAVLDLMSTRRLDVKPLITHYFTIEEAYKAYDLIIRKKEPYLGVMLFYPDKDLKFSRKPIFIKKESITQNKIFRSKEKTESNYVKKVNIGVLGAGNFATTTLFPILKKIENINLIGIYTPGGLSACAAGRKFKFKYCASTEEELLDNHELDAVLILTRHNLHAGQIIRAFKKGKHVFSEKPLCINENELSTIVREFLRNNKLNLKLMIGFNRRFAPMAIRLKEFFRNINEPLIATYRVNAGYIPLDHWVHDFDVGGGRIIGEVCHFVDFLTFIVGKLPIKIYASSLPNNDRYFFDNVNIVIEFEEGSIGNIVYVANGNKAFPKERVEVYGGGRVGILDNFRKLELIGKKKEKIRAYLKPDKGYIGEWNAFIHSIKNNGPLPIAFEQLVSTTLVTFKIMESIRTDKKIEINVKEFIENALKAGIVKNEN